MINLDELTFTTEAYETYTTEVLMQLLFMADTDYAAFDKIGKYIGLAEVIFDRTKLAHNCAYIDLFEQKVYDVDMWNNNFVPWCRKRMNLLQHDLFYNADGTPTHNRADMFHKRKKV